MTAQPPNPFTSAEGREFHRRQFRGVLEIDWGSSILTGSVRDIGPRGLFVELTPPLWLGATFSARLMVNPIIKLNCTVRRVEPGTGMGVRFDALDEHARLQLEALLAALPNL